LRTLLIGHTNIISNDIEMLPKYYGILSKLELRYCEMSSEAVSTLADGISGSCTPV